MAYILICCMQYSQMYSIASIITLRLHIWMAKSTEGLIICCMDTLIIMERDQFLGYMYKTQMVQNNPKDQSETQLHERGLNILIIAVEVPHNTLAKSSLYNNTNAY